MAIFLIVAINTVAFLAYGILYLSDMQYRIGIVLKSVIKR